MFILVLIKFAFKIHIEENRVSSHNLEIMSKVVYLKVSQITIIFLLNVYQVLDIKLAKQFNY